MLPLWRTWMVSSRRASRSFLLFVSLTALGFSCVEPNHGARILANFANLRSPGQTQLDLSKCDGNDCWLDHAAIVAGTFTLMRDDGVMAQRSCAQGVMNAGEYCVVHGSGKVTLSASDKGSASTFVATYRAHLLS